MASHPEGTSSSLLERAKIHDPEAWRRLVRIYSPLVYGWARKAGLQASDASDVVQEVFSSLCTRFSQFQRRNADDTFRGWLWTICRNKIRDFFRAARARPQAVGGSTANLRLQELAPTPPPEDSD